MPFQTAWCPECTHNLLAKVAIYAIAFRANSEARGMSKRRVLTGRA